VYGQKHFDLSQKTVFNMGYPQYFTFRTEVMTPKPGFTYEAWAAPFENTTAILQKFLDDESVAYRPGEYVTQWINRYATENPKKLILLHISGRARQIEFKPDVLKRYFPGHWVLNEGSKTTQAIGADATIIPCEDVNCFSMNIYTEKKAKIKVPPFALIVPLDSEGNRLWYESEYVRLVSIDKDRKELTVSRGELYSMPRSFPRGAYIANLPALMSDVNPRFFYNVSSACPKDKNGQTAADVFVDEFAEWFDRKNGKLKDINGIAFDVTYFSVDDRPAFDANNDGIKDGGYVNDVNIWREGSLDMLKKLKARLGNEFIITSDAEYNKDQQAVNVINGMEQEGLVQSDDAWRAISRTINTQLYWRDNNRVSPSLRYVVMKFTDKNSDEKNSSRLTRYAIGVASCLEAFLGKYPDMSILPNWMRSNGALGYPAGELIRVAARTKNILPWSDAELCKRLKSDDGAFSMTPEGILFTPRPALKGRSIRCYLDPMEIPEGDLTLFLEAKAVDPLEGLSREDLVPRAFYTRLSDLPDYGEGGYNSLYADIYGYFGMGGFSDMSFYYRRDGVAKGDRKFSFEIEGQGKFLIKNIRLYNFPDILVRRFDHGIVVANPALTSQDVDINAIFPDIALKKSNISVPSVDAVFIESGKKQGK